MINTPINRSIDFEKMAETGCYLISTDCVFENSPFNPLEMEEGRQCQQVFVETTDKTNTVRMGKHAYARKLEDGFYWHKLFDLPIPDSDRIKSLEKRVAELEKGLRK